MDMVELRNQIDEIDRQIVALFVQRMDVAAKIGEYKAAHQLLVLDTKRESEKLAQIGALAGEEMAEYAKALYQTVFSLSRQYQDKILSSEVKQ